MSPDNPPSEDHFMIPESGTPKQPPLPPPGTPTHLPPFLSAHTDTPTRTPVPSRTHGTLSHEQIGALTINTLGKRGTA
jgi:hypothetical protein